MNALPIIIVILAIAMMLGPILLLQPNKMQRRLASLRQTAAEKGLQVRMLKRDAEVVAAYQLPWSIARRKRQKWMLKRTSYEHGLHIAGFWQWLDHNRPSPQFEQILAEALPELPSSVVGIEADSYGIAVLWLEQGGEERLNNLIAWLRDIVDAEAKIRLVRDEEPFSNDDPLA